MKASDRGRNVKSKEFFGCFDEFCISKADLILTSPYVFVIIIITIKAAAAAAAAALSAETRLCP